MELDPEGQPHSALMFAMFAARITLADFSILSAMSFAKSPGESEDGMPPKSANRASNLGSVPREYAARDYREAVKGP